MLQKTKNKTKQEKNHCFSSLPWELFWSEERQYKSLLTFPSLIISITPICADLHTSGKIQSLAKEVTLCDGFNMQVSGNTISQLLQCIGM